MRVLSWLDELLSRRSAGLVLLCILGAVYITVYFKHPLYPGSKVDEAPRGWWTWTDQNRYLEESRAIGRWALNENSYFYPVGYPALGAIFVRWMPANPFLIPNLLLVLGATWMWWKIAQRWLSRIAALAVGVTFVLSHTWLVGQTMVIPWNTLPTQFTLLTSIWVMLAMHGKKAVCLLAGLAAVTYLCRPIDAVALAPLLVVATLRLSSWQLRLRGGVAGMAIVAAAVVGVGLMNLAVIGQWQTAYEIVSTQAIGFFGYPMSYKLYWLLVDGTPLFGETDPALLFRFPWLFLAVAGFLFLLQRERAAGGAVFAAIAVNLTLYFNYNDLLPSDIYRFTLIHYIAWIFPLLFLLIAAAIRQLRRSQWVQLGLGIAAGLAVVCSGLRLEARGVSQLKQSAGGFVLPNDRPLLVEFREQPLETAPELRLESRALVEYSEYLVPYLPSHLRVLLGTAASGQALSFIDQEKARGAMLVSRYGWSWQWDPTRWNGRVNSQ